MRVKNVPIADITLAEKNANVMSAEEYAALVRGIKEVGFFQPILIREQDEGGYLMLDGHHRLKAMHELEHTTIPSVVLKADEPLPPNEVISIFMNRARGNLDLASVSIIAHDLFEQGAGLDDLTLMGFSEDEIRDLIDTADSEVPDLDELGSTPEVEPEVVPRPFLLELTFGSRDELKTAKKALRKAAGKGVDLSIGLLRLVGEEV